MRSSVPVELAITGQPCLIIASGFVLLEIVIIILDASPAGITRAAVGSFHNVRSVTSENVQVVASLLSGQTTKLPLTRTINPWIEEMCLELIGQEKMKDWFDVSVIDHGTDEEGGRTAGTAFTEGALNGRERVTISELSEHIAFEESVEQKCYDTSSGDLVTELVKRPGWIRSVANGETAFPHALRKATALASQWISEDDHYERSFPPIVFNITHCGAAADASCMETAESHAETLKSLNTADGQILLFNCLLTTSDSDAVLLPHSVEELPTDAGAKEFYELSSHLPDVLRWNLESNMPALQPDARCFTCNVSDTAPLIRVFWNGSGLRRGVDYD
jgi:hypothetical protein